MSDYPAFPKVPRFNRAAVITEKIDGTNGQIEITPTFDKALWPEHVAQSGYTYASIGEDYFLVRAGSRNRWLTLESDNYGFARWVHENAAELVKLGPGSHFGEWWGSGIQRRYDMDRKYFSLFNVHRWYETEPFANGARVPGLGVVPWLRTVAAEEMPRLGEIVAEELATLRELGSAAAPLFMRPEGIVIFHTASRQLYKVTLEGDESPKGLTAN